MDVEPIVVDPARTTIECMNSSYAGGAKIVYVTPQPYCAYILARRSNQKQSSRCMLESRNSESLSVASGGSAHAS